MNLGLGAGLGFTNPTRPAALSNGGPELLLQAELVSVRGVTDEGVLIRSAALPWRDIVDQARRDKDFLVHFAKHPRKFEEFIAATYERAGFDVTLTPQRADRGRDVIATKAGFGSVRFLDQTKAYSPGHLVTHDDVRAMLGVLSADQNASKGLITTTSDFQPGILKPDGEFARFMPHRLELKNGGQLLDWLAEISGDPCGR